MVGLRHDNVLRVLGAVGLLIQPPRRRLRSRATPLLAPIREGTWCEAAATLDAPMPLVSFVEIPMATARTPPLPVPLSEFREGLMSSK